MMRTSMVSVMAWPRPIEHHKDADPQTRDRCPNRDHLMRWNVIAEYLRHPRGEMYEYHRDAGRYRHNP